ncbi:hypothetical protein FPOAC2_02475 [Fusarium poae]|jgi:hypothetical protein
MTDTGGAMLYSDLELDEQEEAANYHVEELTRMVNRIHPSWELNRDDVTVVMRNTKLMNKLNNLRPKQIVQYLQMHIYLANCYLSTIPESAMPEKRIGNIDVEEIKRKNPGVKGVPRLPDNKVREALIRDKFKCVITGMANPEGAHLFPHSAFSKDNIAMTRYCWRITATLIDEQFFKKYKETVNGKQGFETPDNLVSLARHLHTWLDRGFWYFRPEPRIGTTTDLKFFWLPGAFSVEDNFPKKVDDVRAYIKKMTEALKTAQEEGFLARQPLEGSGWIGTHLENGILLKSGDVFTVSHSSDPQASYFHDMVRIGWACSSIQNQRGVTKGKGSPIGKPSKKRRAPDSPQDDSPQDGAGGGGGGGGGKGEEKKGTSTIRQMAKKTLSLGKALGGKVAK